MTSPSFIASNAPAAVPDVDADIVNHSFYPALKLNAFREAMRVDHITIAQRAISVLEFAIIEVNGRLSGWMQAQINLGFLQLSQVPLASGMPEGTNIRLYLRAVWSIAKALLIEHYRDYDSTTTANSQALELDFTRDDCRRDAAWAINDLMGMSRSTIELI